MAKHRVLTEEQVEESIRFGEAALAAAGHFVREDAPVRVDLRQALRGEITFDEAIERAAARAFADEGSDETRCP